LVLLAAILAASAGSAGEVFAQGAYYRSYSSYYYPRPYNNKYHGYWRDLGYGFSNQPYYGGFHYTERYYPVPAPYYGPSQYGGYAVPGYYGW
jgi:hypothetical protein